MPKHHIDNTMGDMLTNVDSYMKSETNKKQHKATKSTATKNNKKPTPTTNTKKQSKPTNSKTKSTKTTTTESSSDSDYPWTALIGVNEVAKLNAIQQLFGCKSRTEALQLVFKHCKGLIAKNQEVDYKVLCKIFNKKNMPKAKARYQKYFNKKK